MTAKSLDTKAMIVKLKVSQWTARRYDKKVSDEVATLKNADKDAGRYNKALVAQDAIKKVNQAAMAARQFHYEQTLPWYDDGARILPSKNYDSYMKGMRDLRAEFEARVREFCSNYPAMVEAARIKLNGMFNAADYPSASEIAWKYSYNVGIEPIPVAGDFRVGLAGGEVEQIKADIEARLKTATAAAMKDLWERLHDVVARMAEKLKDSDAVFRDTLIGNICELTALLPALNLTDDAELEAMRRKIETTLCTYKPQDLRDNKKERGAAVRDAQSILDAMQSYVGGPK
jgi:hypothetical protein